MDWIKLEHLSQLEEIKALSKFRPVLIFKHSTRCSISSMAWDRLRRNWKQEDFEKVQPFFLDLLSYREISDQIESQFRVYHESPQVILLQDGEAIYDNSHLGINYKDIMSRLA